MDALAIEPPLLNRIADHTIEEAGEEVHFTDRMPTVREQSTAARRYRQKADLLGARVTYTTREVQAAMAALQRAYRAHDEATEELTAADTAETERVDGLRDMKEVLVCVLPMEVQTAIVEKLGYDFFFGWDGWGETIGSHLFTNSDVCPKTWRDARQIQNFQGATMASVWPVSNYYKCRPWFAAAHGSDLCTDGASVAGFWGNTKPPRKVTSRTTVFALKEALGVTIPSFKTGDVEVNTATEIGAVEFICNNPTVVRGLIKNLVYVPTVGRVVAKELIKDGVAIGLYVPYQEIPANRKVSMSTDIDGDCAALHLSPFD